MLLTEIEVAERLRCSASKIRRLRLAGKLPYIKGRPVLVDEADLTAFLEATKQGARSVVLEDGRLAVEVPALRESNKKSPARRAEEVWLRRQIRAKHDKR